MNTKKFAMALCVAVVVVGCSTAGNEKIKDQNQASIQQLLIEGKTTKSEVQEALGNATAVSFTDGGSEVWSYRWARGTPQAKNFIPVVNLFARGTDIQAKELIVMFDRNNVVTRYTLRETNEVVKRGLAQ